MHSSTEVLLLGGPAGVGKTSVAAELHSQLADARVRHALIEGDNLDQAWPTPWRQGLAIAEANLAAMWRTYTDAGYSRLVYTNTAAVRPEVVESLRPALGGDPLLHGVLLTGAPTTLRERLARREIGGALDEHLERSRRAAQELDELAPAWVRRIATDGRTTADIAAEIARHLRWSPYDGDL